MPLRGRFGPRQLKGAQVVADADGNDEALAALPADLFDQLARQGEGDAATVAIAAGDRCVQRGARTWSLAHPAGDCGKKRHACPLSFGQSFAVPGNDTGAGVRWFWCLVGMLAGLPAKPGLKCCLSPQAP